MTGRAFQRFADGVSHAAGSPWTFLLATVVVLAWFVAGFFVGFSNTLYQLAINTGTTIVTFLMVFLIQSTQERLDRAMHAKLDELIRVHEAARNELIGMERPDHDREEMTDAR